MIVKIKKREEINVSSQKKNESLLSNQAQSYAASSSIENHFIKICKTTKSNINYKSNSK